MTTATDNAALPELDPKLIDDTFTSAIAKATDSKDTRDKFKKALDSTGTAKQANIKKALIPDKPVLSRSTTSPTGTKGPKGTKSPGDPRSSSGSATTKDDLVDYLSQEVQKQMATQQKTPRNPILEGKQAARAFVVDLFEQVKDFPFQKEKEETKDKPEEPVSEAPKPTKDKEDDKSEEQEERKSEKGDVRELEKALDRIPQRYFTRIDTAQEAVEAILNGVMDRMNLDKNDKVQFKSLFMKKLQKGI